MLSARAGAFAGHSERSSRKNHYFVRGGIRPSKKYAFNASYIYRDGHFDLDFGNGRRYPRVSPGALLNPNAPLDPGPGGLTQIGFSATWQPTNALNSTLSFTHNDLRRYDTERTAFDVNLVSLRSTSQFTRFLFARARRPITRPAAPRARQFPPRLHAEPGDGPLRRYTTTRSQRLHPSSASFPTGFRRDGRTFSSRSPPHPPQLSGGGAGAVAHT